MNVMWPSQGCGHEVAFSARPMIGEVSEHSHDNIGQICNQKSTSRQIGIAQIFGKGTTRRTGLRARCIPDEVSPTRTRFARAVRLTISANPYHGARLLGQAA